jgi:hypothetical protein
MTPAHMKVPTYSAHHSKRDYAFMTREEFKSMIPVLKRSKTVRALEHAARPFYANLREVPHKLPASNNFF